jgi:hypothetical protein
MVASHKKHNSLQNLRKESGNFYHMLNQAGKIVQLLQVRSAAEFRLHFAITSRYLLTQYISNVAVANSRSIIKVEPDYKVVRKLSGDTVDCHNAENTTFDS